MENPAVANTAALAQICPSEKASNEGGGSGSWGGHSAAKVLVPGARVQTHKGLAGGLPGSGPLVPTPRLLRPSHVLKELPLSASQAALRGTR